MPNTIDLNCDLGEGAGQDDALIPFITSANVACGLHAGEPGEMARVVRLARAHGVAVGAHPGYADREHFGRRDLALTPGEVEALLLYQIGALAALARAEQVPLRHVKPHGALYNRAAQDRELAQTVARAVATFSRELILVGLAGSLLLEAGREAGLRVAGEGFPDRAYNPDGTLRSRGRPGAVLENTEAVAANAVRLATEGVVTARGRAPIETLCLHGDSPHAVEFARAVRAALAQHGFSLTAL